MSVCDAGIITDPAGKLVGLYLEEYAAPFPTQCQRTLQAPEDQVIVQSFFDIYLESFQSIDVFDGAACADNNLPSTTATTTRDIEQPVLVHFEGPINIASFDARSTSNAICVRLTSSNTDVGVASSTGFHMNWTFAGNFPFQFAEIQSMAHLGDNS